MFEKLSLKSAYWIVGISTFLVMGLVIALYYMKGSGFDPGFDIKVIPAFHAILNTELAYY